VGDAFLKWVLSNQGNRQRCEQIQITEISEYNFAEFPSDPNLDGFDLSDRKFVAVAIAHPHKPPILNAVDSDWGDFRVQLATHRVEVEFICPDVVS
jgi:proteasome lid subunit RPN8/RPN11